MDEDVQGLRLAVQVCFDRGPLCRVPTRAKSGGNLLSLPPGMQANLRFLGTALGMAGSGVLARINHDIETMLLPVTRAIIGLSGNRDRPSRTAFLSRLSAVARCGPPPLETPFGQEPGGIAASCALSLTS